MKHISHILTLLVAFLCLSAAAASAQARIQTKKIKISDLTTRTTKVVLGGSLADAALREEVAARWRLSPYEFCTAEEYKALKENSGYYFLFIGSSEEKEYAGIKVLTLAKGGVKSSDDPSKLAVEVASLPLYASESPSGREMALMAGLVDIIQDYALKAMKSDLNGYSGLSIYRKNIRRSGHKSLVLSEDDLSPAIDKSLMDSDTRIVSEAEADRIFTEGTYNTLVSFTVSPAEPRKGDFSYQMLIDAETHELFYFKRHQISESRWAGFDNKDMRAVNAPRKRYNQ